MGQSTTLNGRYFMRFYFIKKQTKITFIIIINVK